MDNAVNGWGFGAIVVVQVSMLAKMWWPDKWSRRPPPAGSGLSLSERRLLVEMNKKVDRLNRHMMNHLEQHTKDAREVRRR